MEKHTFENVSKLIDERGFTKISFEPFSQTNKLTKKELEEKLRISVVSLRGWSFPHIPPHSVDGGKAVPPYKIPDGVEWFSVFGEDIEVDRLYENGIFLCKKTLREDYMNESSLLKKDIKQGEYLDFTWVIYDFTEICLFIEKLCKSIGIEGGKLEITIGNSLNRKMENLFNPYMFTLMGDYELKGMKDSVVYTEFNISEKTYLEIARDLLLKTFENFNADNILESTIESHQNNLLNKR